MSDDAEAVGAPSRHPLYSISDIHVVGTLPEATATLLGLSDDARTVRIHPATVAHICERRNRQDADFAFENLAEAVRRPHMVGTELANFRRLRVVHRVEGAPRWLHVALKLVLAVDGKTGTDEIWVSTAYAMGRSVGQLRNKPTVWHVTGL